MRFLDYRDVREGDFDAISSIGLTEHIGVRNYPAYFAFLKSKLRPGGRLLNHCITRPDNLHDGITRGGFIDRYVFPDGELAGSGHIIQVMQDSGLEVRHEESLREHYAMTLRDWCRNLRDHWDEAVAEVGEGTARVWGLYMAGSRLSFERNRIQLHQVLAVNTPESGDAAFPLRPDWGSALRTTPRASDPAMGPALSGTARIRLRRMTASPSVSNSITVRLELPGRPTAVSELSTVIEQAGGLVSGLDVTASGHDRLRIDVTIMTRSVEHADEIVADMRAVHGVEIGKVSDRTFLVHLGGKLEVVPKLPIRNRDDLSLIYTPGVARVCLAIAANPEDARRLTIKRNTVAVVTDGSAVLGLGNIGPLAAMPVMEGKAALFKRFGDIDAFPICLDTQDVDEIVNCGQGHLAGLRRDQPRGHLGAALLRGREAAARRARHPGLPRRPARYGDRDDRRPDQRAARREQEDRGHPDRHVRRGRGRHGDPQAADGLRRQGRRRLRQPRRRLQRARRPGRPRR